MLFCCDIRALLDCDMAMLVIVAVVFIGIVVSL